MTQEEIKLINETIHIYMGYEYMTNLEIVNYLFSKKRIDEGLDIEYWAKKPNMPNLKRKGAIITTLSHDDVCYYEHLRYHKSIDRILPVIEKLKIEISPKTHTIRFIEELIGEEDFNSENIAKNIYKKINIKNGTDK